MKLCIFFLSTSSHDANISSENSRISFWFVYAQKLTGCELKGGGKKKKWNAERDLINIRANTCACYSKRQRKRRKCASRQLLFSKKKEGKNRIEVDLFFFFLRFFILRSFFFIIIIFGISFFFFCLRLSENNWAIRDFCVAKWTATFIEKQLNRCQLPTPTNNISRYDQKTFFSFSTFKLKIFPLLVVVKEAENSSFCSFPRLVNICFASKFPCCLQEVPKSEKFSPIKIDQKVSFLFNFVYFFFAFFFHER